MSDAPTETPAEAPQAPGLAFKVTGVAEVAGVLPGGVVWLSDAEQAWQLVQGKAIQALHHDQTLDMTTEHDGEAPELKLMDRGDEMILLDFARAGVPFESLKKKKGRA